ncbi:unnamed protein product [Lasius platythorax]|uniref:MADF domain-containing protein n=1 Tax=Lasius platythorax TaxID=488582 RepID=A0AAV2NL70_9HYME
MSDTESLFEEDDVSIDRELITVVRTNRFLYDKTEKLYANVSVKTEAWTQIGASLTHPLEGPVAEKRFYALRQRFGKERKEGCAVYAEVWSWSGPAHIYTNLGVIQGFNIPGGYHQT